MKKFKCMLLSMILLLCLAGRQAAEGTQEQAESEGVAAETPAIVEPVKPPRIPGRAQSQAEWDAWQLVLQGVTSAQKADLARGFLETYPTSGLSANAHYFIAQNYYETNDIDNFILHAEKSLEEIPNSVTFLAELGFFYAERGESEKAMERAGQALQFLDNLQRPAEVSAQDFVVQSRLLKAQAKYALGRAHLNQIDPASENRASDPHLMKAMVNLKECLRMDPKHDYASFRLGFAFRNMNNAEGAMKSYARAAVLGGVAEEPARAELEDILGIVKRAAPESSWAQKSVQQIVDEEAVALEKDLARQQQEISQAVEELQRLEAERQAESEQQPAVQELPLDVLGPAAAPDAADPGL
jgi:tetratricopeptide (TPR) repeat protein